MWGVPWTKERRCILSVCIYNSTTLSLVDPLAQGMSPDLKCQWIVIYRNISDTYPYSLLVFVVSSTCHMYESQQWCYVHIYHPCTISSETFWTMNFSKHFFSLLQYDFLHVTPPMGPLDFMVSQPIADELGWVDVDPYTLQHKKYSKMCKNHHWMSCSFYKLVVFKQLCPAQDNCKA